MKSCAMKCNILFEFEGKTLETETTTRLDFSNTVIATVEQILWSKEINKFKRVPESLSIDRKYPLTVKLM